MVQSWSKKGSLYILATYCMNGICNSHECTSSSEAVRQIISLTCLEAKVNEDH